MSSRCSELSSAEVAWSRLSSSRTPFVRESRLKGGFGDVADGFEAGVQEAGDLAAEGEDTGDTRCCAESIHRDEAGEVAEKVL